MEFVSPIKWVVAFIGSLKGLLTSIEGMVQDDKTSILIVYVTDETPEEDTINTMKKTICKVCSHGGLLIIRNKETLGYFSKSKNRDQIIKALQRIKSMITLFPSKNIPII